MPETSAQIKAREKQDAALAAARAIQDAALAAKKAIQDIATRADKNLDTAYKTVEKIKDVGYEKFYEQLCRVAYAQGWEKEIYDFSTTTLTETEVQDDLDLAEQDDQNAFKRHVNRRNAYLIIMRAGDGHTVESLIQNLPRGNARVVLNCIHNFHHPKTTAGLQAAYVNFHTPTQASTGTTVVTWFAYTSQAAKIVRTSGGHADDNAQLVVLLKGLLPEFNQIRVYLHQQKGLTLIEACDAIMDYARTEGLLELCKGGQGKAKGNIYSVHDSEAKDRDQDKKRTPRQSRKEWIASLATMECPQWPEGKCMWGAKCHKKHVGPEGANKKVSPPPSLSTPPAFPSANLGHVPSGNLGHGPSGPPGCMLCHVGTAHHPSKCPIAGSTPVDFTYLVHCNEPSEPDTKAETETKAEVESKAYTFLIGADNSNKSSSWRESNTFQLLSGLIILILLTPLQFIKGLWKISENVTPVIMMAIVLLLAAVLTKASPTTCEVKLTYASAYIIGQEGTSERGFEWCADTGCNRFVTNCLEDFLPASINDISLTVGVGNGTYVVKKQGDVIIENHCGQTIKLTNVLYMPACGKKLMPASPFINKGCKLTISTKQIDLFSPDHNVLLTGKEIDGLYYFKAKTILPEEFFNRPVQKVVECQGVTNHSGYFGLPVGTIISSLGKDFSAKLLETHQSFGHLNFTKLRKFLGLKQGDNPHCPACAIAMSRKAPLNKTTDRSTRINHRLHIDIGFTSGSLNPFQLCVDDYTRVSHIILLKSKDEVLTEFIDLKKLLDNQHSPWKLAYVRSDNEFVYTSNKWIEYCREEGIEHEFSPPYRHDALGVVERCMQTVGVCFRCMMLHGNAPNAMIHYALVHANTIRNHCPSKANAGRTPLEKQAGAKLPINKRLLKGPLFCLIYVHIYEEERIKHGDRAVACVYLGFDHVNNQFIGMEWTTGKIHYCGDADFMPTIMPFRANPHKVPDWMSENDHLTPSQMVSRPNPVPHSLPTGPRRAYRQHSAVYQDPASAVEETVLPVPASNQPESIRSSIRQHQYLHSTDENGVGVDIRTIPDVNNLLWMFSPHLYHVHDWGPEPSTWAEAMSSPYANRWIIAMLEERESFRVREVYELVPRSQADGHRIFKSRPVLKMKFNPPTAEEPFGSLDKFKYRLTIAAYTSMLVQGVDYKEKFASTVRWAATKLIMAQAVMQDWDLLHIDIKTFFLYGVLDEGKPVFMEQPEGWDTIEKPRDQFVCLLSKAVYGHPSASHCAQKVLKQTLTTNGSFLPTSADDCVYVSDPNLPLYCVGGTHVDDILSTGDQLGLEHMVQTLSSKFEIVAKLNPNIITGVQILRDRKMKFLKLHQGQYVREMLETYGMTNCESIDTPMDPATARALMLLPVDQADPTTISKFQSLVGCLIWLLKTRHDIAFTTNLLARFTLIASRQHLVFAMRVLRYLKGTIEYGIIFLAGFKEDGVITGQADADFAGDLSSSRSTSGGFLKVGQLGTICCRSSLEKKISTSTGQAETYALASLVKDVVWTRQLAHDMRRSMSGPTALDTDNQGVHIQSTKAINHATAKHFRVAQAFIRSKGEDGSIRVNKIGTNDNHSDFLTKALCSELFRKHRDVVMGPKHLQEFVPQIE